MIDKKLIAILILLAGYVLLIRPLKQKAYPEWLQVSAIQRSIAKEKFIAKQKKEIKTNYPAYQKIIKQNESFLFPQDSSLTTDRSKLQKMLKGILKRSGLTIVKITWGEIFDRQGYKKLPISFTARGTPKQLERFLKQVQEAKKLLRFEQITISKYRRKELLVIEAIIVAFKMEPSNHVKG